MSNFDPPAPTMIRKTPIKIGTVLDIQHEASGQDGFISVPQIWYRVGGDLNREMVVPTLSRSPIGHEILGIGDTPKDGEVLKSGMDIRLRSVWENPKYTSWQYLSEWYGDKHASYYGIANEWAKHTIWTIEKILDTNVIGESGDVINSGDRVRIKTKNAKSPDKKMWLSKSSKKHTSVVKKDAPPKEIAWILWSQGTAK